MPVTYAETEKAFVLYTESTELTDDIHFDIDRAFVRAFRRDYKNIIVDLRGAETMSSMFISVLMNTFIQLRELGGDMVLTGLEPNIQRLLRVVRLHTVFSTYDSVEEALAALPNPEPRDVPTFQAAVPQTQRA